ncbi:hypothetical protein H1C71_028540 [Ictidomys tridecemlineatus]|nr:hypothetical protein H1C71_028540 [Ictidomys tridecemlineatus]
MTAQGHWLFVPGHQIVARAQGQSTRPEHRQSPIFFFFALTQPFPALFQTFQIFLSAPLCDLPLILPFLPESLVAVPPLVFRAQARRAMASRMPLLETTLRGPLLRKRCVLPHSEPCSTHRPKSSQSLCNHMACSNCPL